MAVTAERKLVKVLIRMISFIALALTLANVSCRAQQAPAASALTAQQAAWLAVILPSPRRYQRGRLTPYVAGRVDTILARMGSVQIP